MTVKLNTTPWSWQVQASILGPGKVLVRESKESINLHVLELPFRIDRVHFMVEICPSFQVLILHKIKQIPTNPNLTAYVQSADHGRVFACMECNG